MEFEIDIGLRDEMVCFIIDRIIRNLQATKRFLELGGEDYTDICGGIYTYAVEEYGKFLYLISLNPTPPPSSSSPNKTIVTIQYTDDNQGFLDHRHKFKLALDTLPDSCRILNEGGFTSSGFLSSGFITDTTADFEARKSIFYVDFNKDDKFNSILRPPEVDRNSLVKAVDEFLNIMMNVQKQHP